MNQNTIFHRIAKQRGVSPEHVRAEIQSTISAAWNDPISHKKLQQLFPEGQPSPELFILRLAEQLM